MQQVAVLTGDLVGSSELDSQHFATLIHALSRTLADQSERYQCRYEIFRGDAFQLVLTNPTVAVECALNIRLALRSVQSHGKSYDARIGIGIGVIDPLAELISRSNGEAFVLSGRGLDSLKRHYLGIFSDRPVFSQRMDLLTKFADLQIQQLTTKQANALALYWHLPEPSHAALAKQLNSSRVNATKLLNQSQYQLLEEYKQYFKQLMEEFYYGTTGPVCP
ncbi:hypothetical protein ACVFI8_17830 [Agarivorans sp. MS3-6]|uniref:hypothetical protein n=1 Tax=Agarivorans sp. TSD2052 TaxID=2937286 RepID=UPI00200E7C72|nr:hypothetical protein [Agarivorans sp. TSD2052]UPW17291.1 hypothetical protein M0C34_13680 [Agarivorans sp. TSD2052]